MDKHTITIELTQGAINNGYLKLSRNLDFFPADAVGGPNLSSAGRTLEVDFGRGLTVNSDIAGDKGILRERAAVRSFMSRERATAGSKVRITKLKPYRYAISMDSVEVSSEPEGTARQHVPEVVSGDSRSRRHRADPVRGLGLLFKLVLWGVGAVVAIRMFGGN
ncbi:MAG: hypothetical protein Q8L49_09265 [Burkholderiaceae bacterium]|nr:hypothetical protein [Burkholderiaceae bacterium]